MSVEYVLSISICSHDYFANSFKFQWGWWGTGNILNPSVLKPDDITALLDINKNVSPDNLYTHSSYRSRNFNQSVCTCFIGHFFFLFLESSPRIIIPHMYKTFQVFPKNSLFSIIYYHQSFHPTYSKIGVVFHKFRSSAKVKQRKKFTPGIPTSYCPGVDTGTQCASQESNKVERCSKTNCAG